MNFAPIRKAIVAGAGAAFGSFVTGVGLSLSKGLTIDEVGAAAAAAVVFGFGVGKATWLATNKPAV